MPVDANLIVDCERKLVKLGVMGRSNALRLLRKMTEDDLTALQGAEGRRGVQAVIDNWTDENKASTDEVETPVAGPPEISEVEPEAVPHPPSVTEPLDD